MASEENCGCCVVVEFGLEGVVNWVGRCNVYAQATEILGKRANSRPLVVAGEAIPNDREHSCKLHCKGPLLSSENVEVVSPMAASNCKQGRLKTVQLQSLRLDCPQHIGGIQQSERGKAITKFHRVHSEDLEYGTVNIWLYFPIQTLNRASTTFAQLPHISNGPDQAIEIILPPIWETA